MLSDKERNIFGVFDGVGGGDEASVASNLAKEYVKKHALELEGFSLEESQNKMKELLESTNKEILKKSGGHRMGTTASIVKVIDGEKGEKKAIIGNIGDSRVYALYADGVLEQITMDDDFIQSLINGNSIDEKEGRAMQSKFKNVVDEKDLTDDEYALFRRRHIISQSLGTENVEPRTYIVDMNKDKVVKMFIVTSDGIHDNLTEKEIESTSNGGGNIAEKLVSAAKKRSNEKDPKNPLKKHLRAKYDDMSAVIIEIPAKEEKESKNKGKVRKKKKSKKNE